MILILAIILFIIFLIYSIRPRKSEEYTLEGLKLSWLNKAGIEGVVTKWIVTLKDSSGSVVYTYENPDTGNLKDFTNVNMNILDKKESYRFLKTVQNLKRLKSGQLDKLNLRIKRGRIKRNLKKGIF